jgi:ABC-type hemin transport system substrate-binding protein
MDRRTLLAGLAGAGLLAGGAALWAIPGRRRGAGQRWVSLSPSITETVFALGAREQLVGRSAYCTLPPAAASLPAAGTALEPNLEALASLHPGGILMEAARGAQIDAVSRLAPVEALPWLTVADVLGSVTRLGELLGVHAQAEALRAVLDGALEVQAPADGPRALLVLAGEDLGRGPVWFIKRGSLHGAAAHAAGLRDALDEDVDGLPQLPLERLIALDPDLILVLSAQTLDDAGRERLAHAFDAIAPLSARVGVLDGPQVLSTGPSIAALPARLRAEAERLGSR